MPLIIGLFLAVLVNLGLLTLMQQMTSAKKSERLITEDIRLLDFVRVKRDERLEVKKRELPKKPPPPVKKLSPPKMPSPKRSRPDVPTIKLDIPRIAVPLNIAGGPYLGDYIVDAPVIVDKPEVDGEVLPLVRIEPRYPRAAARRGIEGTVTISFFITKDGRVRDPVVTSARPAAVFDKAAIKAILRWKFKPEIVNGQAVERQASQTIEFVLRK